MDRCESLQSAGMTTIITSFYCKLDKDGKHIASCNDADVNEGIYSIN